MDWIVLAAIGFKIAKGPEELCSFQPFCVQFDTNFQRRGRGRNLIAFRIYFQEVGLG
jgi:hypothetical protein